MRTFASILKQQREITTSVAFAGTSIKLSVKGVQFKADAVQQPPLSALLSQRQAGLTVIGYPKELAPPPRRVCKLRLPPTGTFGAPPTAYGHFRCFSLPPTGTFGASAYRDRGRSNIIRFSNSHRGYCRREPRARTLECQVLRHTDTVGNYI